MLRDRVTTPAKAAAADTTAGGGVGLADGFGCGFRLGLALAGADLLLLALALVSTFDLAAAALKVPLARLATLLRGLKGMTLSLGSGSGSWPGRYVESFGRLPTTPEPRLRFLVVEEETAAEGIGAFGSLVDGPSETEEPCSSDEAESSPVGR